MGNVSRQESVPNDDDDDGFYFCLSKRTPLLNGLGFLAGTLID
jgi:hypothetical protein